jgi:hypothetical protein
LGGDRHAADIGGNLANAQGINKPSFAEHDSLAELREACTGDSEGGNSGRYQVGCMAEILAAEARHAGADARADRNCEMAIRNQCCGDSVVRDYEGNIPMGAPGTNFRCGRDDGLCESESRLCESESRLCESELCV